MPDRRHVAIFLPSLLGGGAERVMVTLANGLTARGHRVDLVLVRAQGPYLREVAPGVRVVDLGNSRVLFSLLPLASYLRRERPDAMLSALNHANMLAIVARILSRKKIPLFVSERNSLESISGGLTLRLMRILYPLAEGVIAVSRDLARDMIEKLGLRADRVTAIPNPVDADNLREKALDRPAHPWLAVGEPPVILAVGRLEDQKDYPTLLDAFARLSSERSVRLVILGEGSQRAMLEQRIASLGLSDAVLLPGFQPNPFGWMAACSVYVMSSKYEGFPNTLVQAMACGAKVISTDCPTGPAEILEDGAWGRLVPVGHSQALAKAMAATLDDNAHSQGQQRVKYFDKNIVIKRYEENIFN